MLLAGAKYPALVAKGFALDIRVLVLVLVLIFSYQITRLPNYQILSENGAECIATRTNPRNRVHDGPEGVPLRRLFSTFAPGWPGAGLLIMRLVAGGSLIAHGLMRLWTGPSAQVLIPDAVAIAAGILLLAGLWTPITGALVALLGIWKSITEPGDPWANIFLGTIGIGLALLGPGEWSVDARLFGWKRIDVRKMKNPARMNTNNPESF